ncbi:MULTISPECIES: ATP-binding protein [unclassified Saccharothrix]|uniref:ATP-binding protein n=1 Tax=unclassified Saccharothrix TaxID=2593673 RepID=UPI00307F6C00
MDGDLANTLTGSPTGPVVQAGTIKGNLHFHPSPPPVAINQLPPSVPHFVGRADELATLTEHLDTDAFPITYIAGSAGVGKTTLAVHWAHRCRDRFPDGQLYVDLRGFGPDEPLSPAAAVRRFLDAFQVSGDRLPVDPESQAAMFRSLVQDKRVLVLLDNAVDADQIRPLLPGSPTCAVLITSRNLLPSLVAREQARQVVLDVPTLEEARAILSIHLGADRVRADSRAADALVERCARLPIALTIAGAQAVTEAHRPLDRIATALAELATDDSPHTDLQAIFASSYRALPPDAARLFRLLSLHPGPDIGEDAAASLAGRHPIRPLLTTLIRFSLLTEHAPGRFRSHDLLREYAAELAGAAEPEEAAITRLLDHYLHTARAGERLLYPRRSPIPFDPPAPGTTTTPLADPLAAMRWFAHEHTNLLRVLDLAEQRGMTGHVWRLPWTMSSYFGWRGHWSDWAATQRKAARAALSEGAAEAAVVPLRLLGRIHMLNRRYEDAVEMLEAALRISTEPAEEAHVHHMMSFARLRLGHRADAMRHARQALGLARRAGHPIAEARSLAQLGRVLDEVGEHRGGLAHFRRAAEILSAEDDLLNLASALNAIGRSLHHLGDHRRAVEYYGVVAALERAWGDVWSLARTLDRLGDAQDALGDRTAARSAWTEALSLLVEIDHHDADLVSAKLERA